MILPVVLIAMVALGLVELTLYLSLRWFRGGSRSLDPGRLVRGQLDYGGELYALDESIGMLPLPNVQLQGGVTIPGEPPLRVETRTNEDGCRVTSANEANDDPRPVTGVFGCSWMFGTALNDAQTCAWQVQDAMPDRRIKNYGVGGFSVYQMLLRLERVLNKEALDTVILGYLPWHDERNVGRFHRIPWFSAPFVRTPRREIGSDLARYPHERPTRLLRARRSATLHCVQYLVNWWRGRRGDDATMQREVAERLFLRIRERRQKHGAKLLIVSLQHGNLHADFLTRERFSWTGIMPNVMEPNEAGEYPWLLLPYDYHPNEAANRLFADQIRRALEAMDDGRRIQPELSFLFHNERAPRLNKGETRNIYTLY